MPEISTRKNLNALTDDAFRIRFREWLAEYYPKKWTQSHHRPHLRFHGEEMRAWLKTLNDHGWRAPDWPQEYGGLGLSFRKLLIYKEELNRINAGRIVDNGETQLGPTIMKFGTDKQKAYYLPRILNSDDHWAQGYSEPNAGSDLASLSTKADLQGDNFIVNGQKTWTTFANECTQIYMLVRTGRFEKKQQGISFLLIDLKTPGITINPIQNIAGESELCEVFFDDVVVPKENLVGELHQGWTIAKSLLGHERIWLGDPSMAIRALALSQQLVIELNKQSDPVVMDQLAVLTADLHDYQGLYADTCDRVADTGEIGSEASMLKVYASELLQRISEFNVEIAGEYAVASGDIMVGKTNINLMWQVMMTRPTTIYAGCNEVQRDILAAGMGLPRA
ncbi:MAG: acyl-CoA dehydrogenase family protein [Spongiibacteraceae bacterium]